MGRRLTRGFDSRHVHCHSQTGLMSAANNHSQRKVENMGFPICWKCADAITVRNEDPPGVYDGSLTLIGCEACPDIGGYDDAKDLCPLIDHKPKQPCGPVRYNIAKMTVPPKGCEGTWYKFARQDDPTNHGQAREDMLHLYVGRETAEAAIKALGD